METQNQITQQKKFHLKAISPAEDSSLDQAIKKNNIKSYLRKGMSDISNFSVPKDAKSETLEDHLLQLKNSCSSLRRQINHKESDSEKLRKEAIFANDKRKKMSDEKFDVEVKINDLQKKLDQVNNKRDVAAHSCKTYEHILQRMKKDDIFYQMKNNELLREIKQLRTSLNFTQAKNYSLSQMEKLTMHGLKDAHLEVRKQKSLRQAKIENYHEQTNKKKQQKEKLKDQQKKTDKIRELADEIQDAELMRIKKFMEVQKFLKQLLKSKMNRLKNHYEDYYQAFFQIKSRTSAKDANSLKFQFFNFESSYNEKTVWVKHIEEEIEASKTETKALKQRLLQLQNDEMEMMEKTEEKEEGDRRLKKHELVEKSLQYEFIWEKIMTWLDCQASKLNITGKKSEDSPAQLFNLIHDNLCQKPQEK